MWLPKMMGGKGYDETSISYFTEELASVCLAMANLVGAHYLGLVGLSLSINYRLAYKVSMEIVQGEKNNSIVVSQRWSNMLFQNNSFNNLF